MCLETEDWPVNVVRDGRDVVVSLPCPSSSNFNTRYSLLIPFIVFYY